MGSKTQISWCDHTWNPWQGCHKISEGCSNCYMFREKKRYGQDPNVVVRSAKQTFNAPLKWNKLVKGIHPRVKPLVFVCSWSDFFIEEADQWRDEAVEIMSNCENLIFLVLTKRPVRILNWSLAKMPGTIWLGVTVESGEYLRRIDYLRILNHDVKFVSYEPALGPLSQGIKDNYIDGVDWLISGGESCSDRKADVNWFREVRDICVKYSIPYFHKQNGGYEKIDGCYGGCEIDGQVWHQYPKID